MEWVETTAKTLEAAKEQALDRLGVAADEAEFEVLEEPRPGLFGRMRGEARVRARVAPTAVRPKQDRRGRAKRDRERRGKGDQRQGGKRDGGAQPSDRGETSPPEPVEHSTPVADPSDGGVEMATRSAGRSDRDGRERSGRGRRDRRPGSKQQKEEQVNNDEQGNEPEVAPEEVGAAAATFMSGLAEAFGADAETTVEVDGTEIEVRTTGSELGLMVGHGGRTLTAIQDLARVAAQRRLGDHTTRLRIDVGGYREKRREALERFAVAVAGEVVSSGSAKALEPMQSADRKIVHDALASVDGVSSRSEGDDPMRRVVIEPA